MTRRNASILIVDDDDSIRKLLINCLDESDWCATAASAGEAISLLASRPFNLVLSDITMPGESGLDLCGHVQRSYPNTAVVMISAMTDIDYAVEAMRQGAFDYITKPFDLSRVKLAVDRALRYQQALEDKQRYEQVLEERVRIRTDELKTANDDLNFMLDTLYSNYRATLRGLAGTLEARDIETRGHSDRVVAYSMKLGNKMGLDSNELIALEQGALLHDIGKVGVPDAVLLKPGSLTTEEWVRMREHVGHGLRIIEGVEFLTGARWVVGQHHEKYDGTGYPHKLRGDSIHIHARIFAVADAYDAIRSDRPYRAGQSHEIACEEIAGSSGSHFDPKIVNAFLSISKQEWNEIRRSSLVEGGSRDLMDKRQISSFILSLRSPERLTTKLTALCA
ncbi:MAG TPA: HD domain-containing phosphohydrolase [Blastocatellia bacterium]|nr:HD domain-containing phosphohydrolase [Blastocatellia bacterium]